MNTFMCGSELWVSFRSKNNFAGDRICVACLCGHTLLSAVSAGLSREVSAMLFSSRHLSIPPLGAQSHLPDSLSGDVAGAVLEVNRALVSAVVPHNPLAARSCLFL